MRRAFVFLLSLLNVGVVFAGCLSDSQLNALTERETNYLSQKIPPAFKHALENNTVSVAVEPAEGEGCRATLVVKVPQADIDEANAVLEAQPAKKIMLNAQGYLLPEDTANAAAFNVDATSLQIANADILQTAPFGKLRASIELMYAFITQKRAEVNDTQKNTTPWPDEVTNQVVARCSQRLAAPVCACIAEQYALKIMPNQMEYILNIQENPYALATGANEGFEAINSKAEATCKG